MSHTHCIVICGQSIFALALEAALTHNPTPPTSEIAVVRVHPHLPDVAERIAGLHPSLVLLENCGNHQALTLTLLKQCIPLVALDLESGQGILMTGQPVAVSHHLDFDRLLGYLHATSNELPQKRMAPAKSVY